jgi:hypothetical protein
VLARRLAATRPTVLVGSRIGSDVASRDAVRVVDGDPTDEATLRAAGVRGAARVFALDNSGAVNASVALLVRSLNQAGVAVYARADEGDLVAALRARRLGVDRHNGYRLDFFCIEDVAAVALLDVHDRDLERTAVVVGSDRFAHAVERDLIRRRRRAGTPVAGRSCASTTRPPPLDPQARSTSAQATRTMCCAADCVCCSRATTASSFA